MQIEETKLPGVKLMSSPSTCIQFAPLSKEFKIDALSPGYRWLELFDDGAISTGVQRLQGIERQSLIPPHIVDLIII